MSGPPCVVVEEPTPKTVRLRTSRPPVPLRSPSGLRPTRCGRRLETAEERGGVPKKHRHKMTKELSLHSWTPGTSPRVPTLRTTLTANRSRKRRGGSRRREGGTRIQGSPYDDPRGPTGEGGQVRVSLSGEETRVSGDRGPTFGLEVIETTRTLLVLPDSGPVPYVHPTPVPRKYRFPYTTEAHPIFSHGEGVL